MWPFRRKRSTHPSTDSNEASPAPPPVSHPAIKTPEDRAQSADRRTLLAWDCAHRDAAIAGRPAFVGSCIFARIPAPASLASALTESEQLAAAGQIEEAERVADHLVSEHPDVGAVHVLRGKLFQHAGRPDDAVESWRRGLADSKTALGCYFLIARLRHQQAREGPTVQRAFGMVKVSPSK